ncbi:MAG: TonB-dependent receptor [Cyclobacteriaceae bacterium]
MSRSLLSWLLVITLSSAVQAQQLISGRVVETGTNEVLPLANIINLSTNKGVSTNTEGYFSLFYQQGDSLLLKVTYVGYQSKNLRYGPDDVPDKLNIALEPLSAQLKEVVISADANKFINTDRGISQISLSPKQIALLPSIGETDIFRSLQLLPGVSGTNENSSGLFIRGGTPDQNLVLLDGMTIYRVDHFFGFFSAFNANAIKDVQLFKGAFPAKYGARIGGVVDLTGRTGSFEQVNGNVGVNLLSANASIEVPLSEKVSIFFAGRRSFTDLMQTGVYNAISENLYQQDDIPGLARVTPDFNFYDLNSKINFRPSEKDIISLSYYRGNDFLDESRDIRNEIDIQDSDDDILALIDVDEITDWGNQGLSATWSRQWSPRYFHTMQLATSRYKSNYDVNVDVEATIPNRDSTILEFDFKFEEENIINDLSGRYDGEWLASASHKVAFGASFTQSEIDYLGVFNDTSTLLDLNQKSKLWAGYISDTWTPGSKLQVTAGARLSYYDLTEDILLAPRLSFQYSLTDELKIKAGYGRHYQNVNRIINENVTQGSRDFWLMADDELVRISNSHQYVVGASYNANQWLLNVEAYYNDVSDLTEFSERVGNGSDNPADLFFSGDGVAKGLEILLQKKQGKYTGWVAYTLGRVKNTFTAFNGGEPFPALQDQLHEFKFVNSYEIEGWNFSASFIYGSGRPYSRPSNQYDITLLDGTNANFIGVGPRNGSRLKPYHRLDLSAHHIFPMGKCKGDIGLSIFNFYGRLNTWYFEYDFSQDPVLTTEITYLGFTPNLSFTFTF